jgi:DNA repair exonuclease SbcCD ATPase subunit
MSGSTTAPIKDRGIGDDEQGVIDRLANSRQRLKDAHGYASGNSMQACPSKSKDPDKLPPHGGDCKACKETSGGDHSHSLIRSDEAEKEGRALYEQIRKEPFCKDPLVTADTLDKEKGNMLGVLLCVDKDGKTQVLKAFSGMLGGKVGTLEGWCPPIPTQDPETTKRLERELDDADKQNKEAVARVKKAQEAVTSYNKTEKERDGVLVKRLEEIAGILNPRKVEGVETPPLDESVAQELREEEQKLKEEQTARAELAKSIRQATDTLKDLTKQQSELVLNSPGYLELQEKVRNSEAFKKSLQTSEDLTKQIETLGKTITAGEEAIKKAKEAHKKKKEGTETDEIRSTDELEKFIKEQEAKNKENRDTKKKSAQSLDAKEREQKKLLDVKSNALTSKGYKEVEEQVKGGDPYKELVRQFEAQRVEKARLEEPPEPLRLLQKERSEAEDDLAKKEKSHKLAQGKVVSDWCENRVMTNYAGQVKSFKEMCEPNDPELYQDGRMGSCAAPRLLAQAQKNGWTPVSISEFWVGKDQGAQQDFKKNDRFVPSCDCCRSFMGFALHGLGTSQEKREARLKLEQELRIRHSEESRSLRDRQTEERDQMDKRHEEEDGRVSKEMSVDEYKKALALLKEQHVKEFTDMLDTQATARKELQEKQKKELSELPAV